VDEQKLLGWFRDVLNSEYGIRKEVVTPEARFHDDLGLDSLDEMNLMFDVEQRFDLDIFFGEELDRSTYGQIRTVGEAIRFILSRLDGTRPPGVEPAP
jgi:acyl carrier protein